MSDQDKLLAAIVKLRAEEASWPEAEARYTKDFADAIEAYAEAREAYSAREYGDTDDAAAWMRRTADRLLDAASLWWGAKLEVYARPEVRYPCPTPGDLFTEKQLDEHVESACAPIREELRVAREEIAALREELRKRDSAVIAGPVRLCDRCMEKL